MFLIIFTTIMTYLCRLAIVNRRLIYHLFRSLVVVQMKYNLLAARGMLEDKLYARDNKTELPKKSGNVAVVTGGSRGMGAEIVRMLLKCDMEVIIACRNPEAGEKLIKSIRESDGIKTGETKVMELDNSSLASIRQFAENFKRQYQKLDVLVNNAGVMFCPYAETKDGFEQQYGVNYLSHFLLTHLLLESLEKAGTPENHARIVNVASCAYLLGDIRFDDVNHKQNFITGEAYAQSKLAQMLSTKKLARTFEKRSLPISVHAVHPGFVNTDLFEHTFVDYFKFFKALIFRSPKQGATPIVYAAISPKIEGKSGLYVNHCLDWPVTPVVNDEKLQDKLHDLSLEQIKP